MEYDRPTSLLSPKVRRDQSSISGIGIFAAQPISRGEMVFIKAGHIVTTKHAEEIMSTIGDYAMQISEDHFLAPLSEDDVPPGLIGFNHSCDPNAGPRGEIVFEALRDISAGEEITTDYAMTVDTTHRMSQTFQCECGSKFCRKTITGIDWQLEPLWKRYEYHFSAFIVSKIRRMERLLKVVRGGVERGDEREKLPSRLITIPYDREHDLVFFDRKPTDEDILTLQCYHFEAKSKLYDDFNDSQEHRMRNYKAVHKLIRDRLRSDAPVPRVLAYGCGTAKRESQIVDSLDGSPDLLGVDISPQMCAIAQARGVRVLNAPLSYLQGKEELFDVALGLEVFGALSSEVRRRQTLRELRQLLKVGALFFLDAPNLADQFGWGDAIQSAFLKHDLGALGYEKGDFFFRESGISYPCFWHYFEEQELRTLLEEAGFRVESIQYVGYGGKSGEIFDSRSGDMFIEARAV